MSDYFDRIEQQLVQRVEAGAPREYRLRVPWGGLAAAAVVLVVVAVAGAFLLTLRSGPRAAGRLATVCWQQRHAQPAARNSGGDR